MKKAFLALVAIATGLGFASSAFAEDYHHHHVVCHKVMVHHHWEKRCH
jgi:hypothetical protein